MAGSSYREEVGEEDLDLESKFRGNINMPGESSAEAVNDGGVGETGATGEGRHVEIVSERSRAESEGAYQNILSKVRGGAKQATDTSQDDSDIATDAKSIALMEDKQQQVDRLVEIATTKSVVHAVDVARKLNDFYVLDKVHDTLIADEFHDALVSKGLIGK